MSFNLLIPSILNGYILGVQTLRFHFSQSYAVFLNTLSIIVHFNMLIGERVLTCFH